MIRITHRRGCNLFFLLTPGGEPIAIETHRRAWRVNRFPRFWREITR